MTTTAAIAVLSRPPTEYVPPSERGSALAYDPTMNTRPSWVDMIVIPPTK